MSLGFSFYLGIADRIYVGPDGGFSVKYGSPSENPSLPDEVNGSLNVANIFLPPYLYSTNTCKNF